MTKRVIKNEVRYIDQHIAIVDYKGAPHEADVIQWLLKVGTNEMDELKPMRQLVERCSFMLRRCASIPAISSCDLADIESIKALGYSVHENKGAENLPPEYDEPRPEYDMRLSRVVVQESFDDASPFAGHPFGGDETGRYCVELYRVREAAEAVRLVARLALLARGDDSAAGLIHLLDSSSPDRMLSFYALIPISILQDFDTASDRLKALYDPTLAQITKVKDENSMLRLHLSVFASNYYHGAGAFPEDEKNRKMIAANCLLSTLLNYSMNAPYFPDPESGLPKRTERANLLTAIVDFAQKGMLEGCPRCGWPVFKPYESSDPYCRKSHRTRTDEKKEGRSSWHE